MILWLKDLYELYYIFNLFGGSLFRCVFIMLNFCFVLLIFELILLIKFLKMIIK